MTPILKYLVEHFERTGYEPWVDALLFLLVVSFVLASVWRLLGRGTQNGIKNAMLLAVQPRPDSKGYAPEWETFRLRVDPYVELCRSMFCALLGAYSAGIVGVALVFGNRRAPWWAVPLAWTFIAVGFWYMRLCLESASWAYHRIRRG